MFPVIKNTFPYWLSLLENLKINVLKDKPIFQVKVWCYPIKILKYNTFNLVLLKVLY